MTKITKKNSDYWTHGEPRITSLTLKIMAVNALTLLILLFGILYLSQYQTRLTAAKLETFGSQVSLIAQGINTDEDWQIRQDIQDFHRITGHGMQLYDENGTIAVDLPPLPSSQKHKRTYQSIEILKTFGRMLAGLLPDQDKLPPYNKASINQILDNAANGNTSLSAWRNANGQVVLAAATMLNNQNILVLTRVGTDIESELGQVWINIIKVFLGALILTLLLSAYLARMIARPLKRLARAAEKIRKTRPHSVFIPDLSDRHDEIGELSIALRQMTDALWQRMDAIDSFAADVSHELKNPLTSLRSAIETLPKVKRKKEKDKLLDIITHDLERLDRLITDISRASRLDAELSRERSHPIQIADLIKIVTNIYRNPLERDADECVYEMMVDNKMLCFTGDVKSTAEIMGIENKLLQVFENLIANALSFSPENGTVTVNVKAEKDYILINVTDEGSGIPNDKREEIFKRFYSERPTTELYGQHSGLGLSIVKQIIESMNGTITAENTNKGACFVITLPTV